jgi:hypothetical protein
MIYAQTYYYYHILLQGIGIIIIIIIIIPHFVSTQQMSLAANEICNGPKVNMFDKLFT